MLSSTNNSPIYYLIEIDNSIVAKQEKIGWGKAIVETLAQDLQKAFPGKQGFSVQNLWNMRQFYSAYKDNPKLQPLVGEISGTKHVIIMQRCKDGIQREFYIKTTKKFCRTKAARLSSMH